MVIDCHVHLSMFGHEGRNYRQIRDSLLSRMARSGVDYAFVFPDSEPNTGVADLNTTREVIRDWPNLLMLGAVSIPLIDAEIVNELDVLAEAGDIIGIKLYPDDERCRAVYELCQRHNLPVVFHSGETMNEPWREQYNHPHQIAKVAQRYPTMRILVAHFSQPHLEACRDVVLNHRHVYADISGLAHPDVIGCCGREALRRILEDVVIQQPGKVLFGTDWPICDVDEHLRLVRSLRVSDATKNLILSCNAERVFALELDG